MKMKRERIQALAYGIKKYNDSNVKLPFKANYAIQRTMEAIRAEVVAMEKSIKDIDESLAAEVRCLREKFADKVSTDNGEISLVREGKIVCSKRESELAFALKTVEELQKTRSVEVDAFLAEEIEVGLHTFPMPTKEDEIKKFDELGGILAGLMPLIT